MMIDSTESCNQWLIHSLNILRYSFSSNEKLKTWHFLSYFLTTMFKEIIKIAIVSSIFILMSHLLAVIDQYYLLIVTLFSSFIEVIRLSRVIEQLCIQFSELSRRIIVFMTFFMHDCFFFLQMSSASLQIISRITKVWQIIWTHELQLSSLWIFSEKFAHELSLSSLIKWRNNVEINNHKVSLIRETSSSL